jgi:hypothetical protein
MFRLLVALFVVLAAASLWFTSSSLQNTEVQRLQAPAPDTPTVDPNQPKQPDKPLAPSTPEPTGVDVQAPQLLLIALSPTEINTTASSQTLTVTVQITDDLSGMAHATLHFVPEIGGTQELNFQIGSELRVHGDLRDGIYMASATLPKYAANGLWQLAGITLADNANNRCGDSPLPDCLPIKKLPAFTNFAESISPAEPIKTVEPEAANDETTPLANDIFLPALSDN